MAECVHSRECHLICRRYSYELRKQFFEEDTDKFRSAEALRAEVVELPIIIRG